MNQALGNVGATVFYTEPVEAQPTNHAESLRELARDMAANAVQLLIILGGNPVYSAPADLNFASLLVQIEFHRPTVAVRGRDFRFVPLARSRSALSGILERRARLRRHGDDPSTADCAALRRRTAHELLSVLLGQPEQTSYEIVRDYWKRQSGQQDFERFWRKSVT